MNEPVLPTNELCFTGIDGISSAGGSFDLRNVNLESEFGMNDASNLGITHEWELGLGDNHEYDPGEYYGVKNGVENPRGMANHGGSDRHGVPLAESVGQELPPHKTSTGLRTPAVPNPFFDQRDASNVKKIRPLYQS